MAVTEVAVEMVEVGLPAMIMLAEIEGCQSVDESIVNLVRCDVEGGGGGGGGGGT